MFIKTLVKLSNEQCLNSKRFTCDSTETVRPLNSVLFPTKSGKKLIEWLGEAETAFLEIKTKLGNAALLAFLAPDAETAVFVDASATGCGGVLQQKIESKWKPLSLFSQPLNSTQTRYATFDGELPAVYLAIKYFRYFIGGQKFTIFADHAPFCKALFSRSPKSSLRQQRHLDYVAQFTSDLRHVKDEENIVADCLSRISASVFQEIISTDFLELAAAQERDPTIQHLQRTSNSIANQSLSLLGDVSTGKFRPIVPQEFRKKIFTSIHGLSHPGRYISFTTFNKILRSKNMEFDPAQIQKLIS